MPLVEIECVAAEGSPGPAVSAAQCLADALGAVFDSPPGRTWVRLRRLPAADYAENHSPTLADDALPVFVTVLHAQLPEGAAMVEQLVRITAAVADVLACPLQRVHVQYAPAAAGRQAFGGTLVR